MPCSRPPSTQVTEPDTVNSGCLHAHLSLCHSPRCRKWQQRPHHVWFGIAECVRLFVAAALLAQQGLAPADSHSDLAVPEYSQQWEEPPRARQGDSDRGKPQWNYKLVIAMNPHDTES